jgi:hypothetical protein
MSVQDFPIWEIYWPRIRPGALWLYFDVGLGLPDELPLSDDPAQLVGWIRNTQKRADVVIERARDVLLVELRHAAQMNAVGRLLGYKKLLEQDNPFGKIVIPVLVTDRHDSEVRDLAADLDIVYIVVYCLVLISDDAVEQLVEFL